MGACAGVTSPSLRVLRLIHFVTFALYALGFGLWLRLLAGGARTKGATLPSVVVGLAVATHALALGSFWVRYGELPLVGPGAAFSSLAFVGGVTLLLLIPARQVARVGVALLPFILICQGTALLLGVKPSGQILAFQGVGFVLHVTFAFLGYQALALSAAAGSLYLIQHREIKAKRMSRFFHFIPPLATLDLLGKVGVGIGFVSISLALTFAWAWTLQNPGVLSLGDPKVIWALLSWGVFGVVLMLRRGSSQREYRSAQASVIGFSVIFGSYLVLRLFVDGTGFLR